MENPGELTLSQEFQLRVLSEQLITLNVQQVRECAIEATRQTMVKDNWANQAFREYFLAPLKLK